ncbi:MAG: hypothetical protein SGI90_11210 [Candidatus Eisenbacteria bacterium]|nr:hypothetical protein [Candidatus Eisenbacteria bacterium]
MPPILNRLVALLRAAPLILIPAIAGAGPGTLRPVVFKDIVGAPGSYNLPFVLEPDETLPDGRARLAMFDFGPDEQPAGRRIAFGTRSRNASFGWMDGMVRQITRRIGISGPYLCDFVEGEDARFVIAVEPPDALYQVALTLGDPDSARGPIDILANDEVVLDDVVTRPGEPIEAVFEVRAEDGWLSFRLRGEGCQAWATPGAVVYGPPEARLRNLFPATETRGLVPPPDSLTIVSRSEAPEILRKFCQYLLRWAPADGGFSYAGSWYQNAYPLRTLLAASTLLGEAAFRDTAFQVIDRFVAEQKPDGRWLSNYFGRPGCHLAANQDTTSSNLADIGSMTLVVALAAPMADPDRRDRYLAALRRYADNVVLPVQRPDGAFPNLIYQGRMYTHPYSVATACQASSLAALGAVTGEARYLEAAERAGLWLAACIRPDGRVVFSPHDTSTVKIVQPSSFGDLFYIVEALTWAGRYAPRREAQVTMRQALRSYFHGEGGLLAVSREGYWWSSRSLWSDSKMGGILYVLARLEEGRSDNMTSKIMIRGLSWMADAGLSERMGIQAPPASKNGEYGLVATGFAGISVAAMIDPSVLLPPVPVPVPATGKP